MNLKENLMWIIPSIIFVLIMLLVTHCVFTERISASYDFCHLKGYDYASIDGFYSPRFDKVKCQSCYNYECISKEFDVKMGFFGLKESK